MDLSHSHSRGQRVLRQRNLLAGIAIVLALIVLLLLGLALTRDRQVVLLPVLKSPLTISSAGVSRDYLEMITRDTAMLTLNRSPQNLDYWMNAVLDITSPRTQGQVKADLLRIMTEQRGSSIAQFFTVQSMKLDPKALRSEVTGELHTIVGSRQVASEARTFRYDWEYSGLSLKLIGFGMVTTGKDKQTGSPS